MRFTDAREQRNTKGAWVLVMAAVLVLLPGRPAAAQATPDEPQTRSEGLSSARDAKARQLAPPESSIVEKALRWYDEQNGRLQWRGVHFAGGGFPAGAGFGYGVGITKRAIGSPLAEPSLPNRIDFNLAAARTFRGYQRMAARVDLLNAGGQPFDLTLSWLDERRPLEDFYGLGQDSLEANRTEYRMDGGQLAIDARWRPFARVKLGAGVAFLNPTVTASAPDFTALPDFMRSSVSFTYDWRDEATHPRGGGRYRANWSFFDDRDGDAHDFQRVELVAQQIVPLGNRYRRLALRAAAVMSRADDNASVPVIYLPSLGGSVTLRGFRDARFRDRHAVALSAEYQWEAWWALDAAVFVDAGQVMRTLGELAVERMDVTYGFGLRLHTNNAFLARLDFGFSREGFVPIVGFSYGF